MADTEQGVGSAASNIGRAIAGPVRAVSRIFNSSTQATGPAKQLVPNGNAVVDCGLYINGDRQPGEWDYVQALAAARKRDDAFVWLGLHEPTVEDLEGIAQTFDLDDFAVEDSVKGGQRPKIEQYGEMTFLVVRTARYVEHVELTETSEIVETGDLMMFIGPNYVITVRHGEIGALGPIRTDLEERPELLGLGPWSVVYTILDRVVDHYLAVASRVEEDIDAVEVNVFSRQVHGRIARIYQLKRELVEFKRAVMPLQRPLRGGPHQFGMVILFRKVRQNHVRRTSIIVRHQEFRECFVGQMPHAAHDALLDHPGIGPVAQHFQIMIRFY